MAARDPKSGRFVAVAEVSLDAKAFNRAWGEFPKQLLVETRKGFQDVLLDYQRRWIRKRLSGRKDGKDIRDAKGNLVSWGKGLKRPSGGLVRDLTPVPRVTGTSIAGLEGRMGFTSRKGRMIATMHELGTVKYGGELPDIVSKTGGMLRWPVRQSGRAMGKVTGFMFAKKVGLPPRLEYIKLWNTREAQTRRNKILNKAIARAIKRGKAGR